MATEYRYLWIMLSLFSVFIERLSTRRSGSSLWKINARAAQDRNTNGLWNRAADGYFLVSVRLFCYILINSFLVGGLPWEMLRFL